MHERGSVGMFVTVVLLCIVPASVVVVSLAETALSAAEMVRTYREVSRRRYDAVTAVAAYLNDQVIPYGVRGFDIATSNGPRKVHVTDLGSRFPVYFMSTETIPPEIWPAVLLPGGSIEDFEAARATCGPSLNTAQRFAGVVRFRVFDELFTAYARDAGPWAPDPGAAVINVNAAPLVVLESAIKSTGIEGPREIARRLGSLRQNGAIHATDLAAIDPSGRLQTVLRDSPIFVELRITLDDEPIRAVLARDSSGEFHIIAGPSSGAQRRGGTDSDR